MSRGGPPALAVADDQPGVTPLAERAPEGADGDTGQVKVQSDLRESLAVEVAIDDLVAGDERNGTGHGKISRDLEREYPKILPIPLPRGYNFVSRLGV